MSFFFKKFKYFFEKCSKRLVNYIDYGIITII